MAEVYPSDNELLNIESDSETGVEFIATGQSPYYLQFRKMLSRLLLATKRANDLRVYDEGGLDIGVRAGAFWVGNELVEFAGVEGMTLADDKEHIYIYLDDEGVLVSDEYAGFPDMGSEGHVRLGVVSTSNGDIDSIVDSRGGHGIAVPAFAGGERKVVEDHTADDTLEVCESGSVHTNRGATGTVTITLPDTSEAGVTFSFSVQAIQWLRIEPGNGTIKDNSGQAPGKYKYSGTIGDCMTVVSDGNGDWVATSKSGDWMEEV